MRIHPNNDNATVNNTTTSTDFAAFLLGSRRRYMQRPECVHVEFRIRGELRGQIRFH